MKDQGDSAGPVRDGTSPPAGRANPDTTQLAAQMSALLAELVRLPEADLGEVGPALREGDVLGRLTLRRQIGRGGFGIVWEAEDLGLGRTVAVKAVKPGRALAARGEAWLKREAEAVARLNHPNIVTLYDFGSSPAGPYLVFELLRGRTLDARLEDGSLPFRSILAIAIDISRALVHAHRCGVVHRDLKPANVFVADDGAVKVLDFGVAHLLGRVGPGEGGTPSFMAPEQWRGEAGDERTDLFALGVLLHLALTGEVPYPVKDRRSAVQDPGPTPQLPPKVAPARLRKLVRRCLEREPGQRPASAQEVLDELRAIQGTIEGRGRFRLLAGLGALTVAATLVAGWLLWTQEPPPGERLSVVVADADNLSGQGALDGVSGLLTAALEPSRRLQLVPRPRLLAVAREAKLGELARVDAHAGREVGRLLGAQVLLLPVARREGTGVLIAVQGVEPVSERALFSVSESAAGTAEVPPVLDRLAEAVRRKLRERSSDLSAGRLSVTRTLTPSLEAAHLYFQGLDCVNRPGAFGFTHATDCRSRFEQALALDPSFSLAHYRLALLDTLEGAPADSDRRHLDAALRGVERLAPRDARQVQALLARVEGHPEEAIRLYDQVLAEAPEDEDVLDQASTVQIRRGAWEAALPYLEKMRALDPGADRVTSTLVRGLGTLGRREQLRALVEKTRALPSSPERIEAVAHGLVWLGEPGPALVAARRAVADGVGPQAQSAVAGALLVKGDLDELEAMSRARVAANPGRAPSYWFLAGVEAGQGRFDQALRTLDEAAARGEAVDPAEQQGVRAVIVAGRGNPAQLWREAARLEALDAGYAADEAVLLALAGDLEHAAALARRLTPGGLGSEQYRALVMWRQGDPVRALAQLAAAERREPWPVEGLLPAYLIAEVASAAGDHREVLAAVERFRRLWPRGYEYGWASSRLLYLTAEAHLALGERAAARADLDLLLARLRRADAGLPLLGAARALLARL